MNRLVLVVALVVGTCMLARGERTPATIRADYLAVRTQLASSGGRFNREKVEASGLLDRAFALIFTFIDHGGTPYAAAVRIPDPKAE